MKFVVHQEPFSVTEVKLYWETKDKIKKVALGVGVIAAVAIAYYNRDFLKTFIVEK